jgi:hypothetical protein
MSGHYLEALKWIKKNPGTGGAAGLAKMVLSLYDSDCGFAFSECAGGLDGNLTALCLKMCEEYERVGETEELRQVGKELADQHYPRLWEQSVAMRDARHALMQKWQNEDRMAKEQEERNRRAEEREENRADEKLIEEHDRLRGTYRRYD